MAYIVSKSTTVHTTTSGSCTPTKHLLWAKAIPFERDTFVPMFPVYVNFSLQC